MYAIRSYYAVVLTPPLSAPLGGRAALAAGPAGFWVRSLAALVDVLVVWGASFLLTLPFGGPLGEIGSQVA